MMSALYMYSMLFNNNFKMLFTNLRSLLQMKMLVIACGKLQFYIILHK